MACTQSASLACVAQVTADGVALHFVEPEQARQRAAEIRGERNSHVMYRLVVRPEQGVLAGGLGIPRTPEGFNEAPT